MSKQTGVHMLAEDCRNFLKFVQERDPVVVTHWDSGEPIIEEVRSAHERGGFYCLWNQALLPSLKRALVPQSDLGPYYRVSSGLPVVEFSYPNPGPRQWNGRLAQVQGRVWAESTG